MRITCPYCGPRGYDEFAYHGDATLTRPDPTGPEAEQAFCDYVYFRDNPSGRHREWWYHAAGCRMWLCVERDTRSHAVLSAVAASQAPGPARRDAS
jgi:methylglutamate dehydrogenase subunit B